MKIRAYPSLQQEGQAPRAGEKKESAPATRRSLPLLQDNSYYQEAEICENLRSRVHTCLAELQKAQADLSALQGEEQRLAEAERLYEQVGQFLTGRERPEQAKNMELLYLSLGKVREKLAELVPQLALDPAAVPAKAGVKDDDAAASAADELEAEISHLSTELELARQKLTVRQKELIAAIARNLVAVENIAASSSAIRDAANARKVIAEVRDKLATNPHNYLLSQANRDNIAALLE